MSEPLTEAELRRWCRELGYWWAPEMWQDADGIYAGNTFMRLRGSPLPPMRRDRRQFKNTVAGLLDWLGWLSKGGVTLPGVVAHVYMCRAHLRESLYALDREVDQIRMWPSREDRVLVIEELGGAWRLELAGIPRKEYGNGFIAPVYPRPYSTWPRRKRRGYDGEWWNDSDS